MKNLTALIVLLLIMFNAYSQQYTISGIIEDMKTGEHILAANAYDASTLKGTTSNYYGFYSLKLPAGKIKLTFSYAGYQSVVSEFELKKDTVINPKLDPVTVLGEVIVSSNRRNIVQNNQMSLIEMSAIQTKKLPVFMGESDIIKTIQLLPGVKGGTEGTSGMYVRGGGPDQNLILLDGVPVYNATHLFGFFSVFNSDAIQNFSLLKGGFPARYGGRLSSVLDIKMKEGNNKKFGGEASIGLISSKVTLEGPIHDENTSFIVSGRRTYIDVIPYLYLKATNSSVVGGYYFYDINAKINHKFSDKSRIYYSFYTGLDEFYSDQKTETSSSSTRSGWGNDIHALRWNYVLNENLFANATTTYSGYNFFVEAGNNSNDLGNNNDFKIKYSSGIKDWSGKLDFDFIPSTRHYIRFGGNYTYHTFNPGVSTFKYIIADIDTSLGNFPVYAHEAYLYAEDDIELSEKLKVNLGTHYSVFHVKSKTYSSLQPRVSVRYLINDNLSVKASVVEMKQYIHLLSTSNIGLPTDLWVPATDKIKPMDAWQYSIGIAYNINDNYDFSVEAYYKTMFNLIEYKEGASFFSLNNSWENKVESGKGWGKGVEFLINKKNGKITGWAGYTLAYADRQFDNISFGKVFPYKYDIRHDIGLAMTYKSSEKFDMGLAWVFMSGQAVTLAEKQYPSPDLLHKTIDVNGSSLNPRDNYVNQFSAIEYFDKRNNYRMPSYHRLDLSFNFYKKKKHGLRTWSLGTYNTYNHQNPFYLFFDYKNSPGLPGTGYGGNGKKVLKQLSIFPIIPFVKYSYKF
jgi:outer membrane receptor for ferrienterochelin and colicin